VSDVPSFLAAAMRFAAPAQVTVLDASSATSLRESDQGAMCVSAVGAITADRSVNLPAVDGAIYVCENATTGGHGVTFRTSSASGVKLDPGERALLRCSVATYARVGAAPGSGGSGGASPRALTLVTGAGIGPGFVIALDDEDAIVYPDTSTASALIVLPPATTLQREVTVACDGGGGGGTNIAKVGADGSDAIADGTYVEIAAWESATFTVIAAGQWVITGGRGSFVVA